MAIIVNEAAITIHMQDLCRNADLEYLEYVSRSGVIWHIFICFVIVILEISSLVSMHPELVYIHTSSI